MAEIDDQIILSAKVAMLERLVRALCKDIFLKAEDPIAAVESYAERYTKAFEKGLASMAREGTAIYDLVLLENLTKFFDELRHDVESTLRNRES